MPKGHTKASLSGCLEEVRFVFWHKQGSDWKKSLSRVDATSELPGSRWVVKRPRTKQIIFKMALSKQSEVVGFAERTLRK